VDPGDPQLQEVRPGYAVKYENGYTSWSPKDVFEEAYKPLTALDFAGALFMLKRGKKVTRKGWDVQVELNPDTGVVHYGSPDGPRLPFIPNQEDLLAEDWIVVE
jgi:hypothetical protein